MTMISANYYDESLFFPNGNYFVDSITQPIFSPTQLLDVAKITLEPLCPKLLIAPKASNELNRMFDDYVRESLLEIEKTQVLIHPAYARGIMNYTHLLDKILFSDTYSDRYWFSEPTVRFNGARVYAKENSEFYEARPMAVVLQRGERADWSQRVSANYFFEISSYLHDEAGSPSLIYIEKLIKDSGIDIKTLSEYDGLYLCDDFTCVIQR